MNVVIAFGFVWSRPRHWTAPRSRRSRTPRSDGRPARIRKSFLAQVGDKAPREGPFRNSEGWPENSPVWTSTMDSYRVVWLFHRRLTPKYRQLVATASSYNRVHHLRSPRGCRTLSYLGAVHQSISGPGAQSGDQLAQPCSVGSNTVVGTIRNCRDGLTMSALKGIVLQKLKTERCRKSRKS